MTARDGVAPESLVGAWHLVAWEVHAAGERRLPFGQEPVGILSYTADGALQATVTAEGRAPFSATSARRSPDAEVAAAARTYFSYAGRWHLDGLEVVHEVTLALDPGLVGTRQRRRVDLEGDRLVLSADETVDGQARHHRLTWRRNVPRGPV